MDLIINVSELPKKMGKIEAISTIVSNGGKVIIFL